MDPIVTSGCVHDPRRSRAAAEVHTIASASSATAVVCAAALSAQAQHVQLRGSEEAFGRRHFESNLTRNPALTLAHTQLGDGQFK